VVVRLREEERSNLEALRGLLLEPPDGSQVPLDQVAKIGVQEGVLNISRESWTQHTAAIGVFIKDRDMGKPRSGDAAGRGKESQASGWLQHHLGRRV
jgi:Cu/Ag efflux pump CusA